MYDMYSAVKSCIRGKEVWMKISAHQGGVMRIGEVEEDSWPPNKQGLTCIASLNGSSGIGTSSSSQ